MTETLLKLNPHQLLKHGFVTISQVMHLADFHLASMQEKILVNTIIILKVNTILIATLFFTRL